jgi:hypothetical protein
MTNYEVTIQEGKNYVARIYKPILTEEENKKREENIKAALVQFAKEKRSRNV